MSLARKYRPQTFADLVGQEPISQALIHSLSRKDAPQTFLFSGIRGTGKTTLARLYATALNCGHPNGFKACKTIRGDQQPPAKDFKCPSCDQIAQGGHEDIWEIDGASHNSVDHVRELTETLLYGPRAGSKKVYIIDEVHMLSTSAFNALLKTLEEPPSYVVFILATTELQKIPATVISRCQTFHLRRIPRQDMVTRFEQLLKCEQISYDPKALILVAEQAEGSLRDGLSILDQMIALGNGSVSYDTAVSLMSYAPTSDFMPLWSAILQRHTATAASALSELFQKGFEAKIIAEHLTKCAHKTSLIARACSSEELIRLGVSNEEHALIKDMLNEPDHHSQHLLAIRRFITHIGQLFLQFSGSGIDRYLLDNHILEWISLNPTKLQETSQSPSQSPPSQPPSSAPDSPAPKPPQPLSWTELMTALQKTHPIQTAELMSIHAQAITYSPSHIDIRVKWHHQPQSHKKKTEQLSRSLTAILQECYGFTGTLTIHSGEPNTASNSLSIADLVDQDPQQFKQMISTTSLGRTIKEHFPSSSLSLEHSQDSKA